MSNDHPRFAEFISKCCEALELPPPTITNDRYMFQVEDRWIELKCNDRGDLVNFVSLAYLAPPDTAVRADLVAGFNVYHLFNGGFTLIADEPDEMTRLYVCRPHRLDVLDAKRIREDLIACAEAAAMAGAWYIRTTEDETHPALSSASFGDLSNFLKV
jgi:hypothetical protein